MNKLWLKTAPLFALVAVAAVACSSGSDQVSSGPPPTVAEPVATLAAPVGVPLSAAQTCAETYDRAPAYMAVDASAPLSVDEAVGSPVARLDATLESVTTESGPTQVLTTDFEGVPTTVVLSSTTMVMRFVVNDVSGTLGDVSKGDRVEVQMLYDRTVPGGPDRAKQIAELSTACMPGTKAVLYPTGILRAGEVPRVEALPAAVLLTDGEQFVSMEPFGAPVDGVTAGSLATFDAAVPVD